MNFDQSSRGAFSIAGAALALLLAGCATPPSEPAARAEFERTNDPLEPLNRKTFAFNEFIDHAALRPAAKAYVAVVPDDFRTAIHHVLDNMKEPTLFFNHVMQGDFRRAGVTAGRFVVNSTVGFAGMVDVMALSGVKREPADFGQTLYVWGVPSGPYLVLPIFGPTNPRDAVGSAVDSYADPATILANNENINSLLFDRFIVGGLDERANVLDVLDDLEKNSVDFYAELRSLSQQHRQAELNHGEAPKAAPGLYDDPGQAAPPPAPAKPGAATAPAKPGAAKPAAKPVAAKPMARRIAAHPARKSRGMEPTASQTAALPPPQRNDPDEGRLR